MIYSCAGYGNAALSFVRRGCFRDLCSYTAETQLIKTGGSMADAKRLKMNPLQNRLIGSMPKIASDPRSMGAAGGVRGPLEDQTMGMAKNVARFLSENLRHPNGRSPRRGDRRPVHGGAAPRRRWLLRSSARRTSAFSLTVTLRWCYGSETMGYGPADPQGHLGLQWN